MCYRFFYFSSRYRARIFAKTADAVETDPKKEYIMANATESVDLHLGQNYHTNQYQIGKAVR